MCPGSKTMEAGHAVYRRRPHPRDGRPPMRSLDTPSVSQVATG